ncbi:addiction module protein [Maribacter sp. 2-571]|uniref:addiction module protein n=1 Tax=Maribacter sp. 2-571 TaxID=3417569 RepID=UPI003D32AC1D
MDINVNVMDLDADIKWIRKELKEVKDPTLIEAFKNLLQYRKKVSDVPYEISDEHKAVLDERLEYHKANPDELLDWEGVKSKW